MLGRACFLDIPSVVSVTKDQLPMYNPRLPGYVRDLVATRGPVVGLVPHDWCLSNQKEITSLLYPVLVGKMREGRFRFLTFFDDDYVRPMQVLRRAMSLRWSRCSCIFGQDSAWAESLANVLGISHKEIVDRMVLP